MAITFISSRKSVHPAGAATPPSGLGPTEARMVLDVEPGTRVAAPPGYKLVQRGKRFRVYRKSSKARGTMPHGQA